MVDWKNYYAEYEPPKWYKEPFRYFMVWFGYPLLYRILLKLAKMFYWDIGGKDGKTT